MTDRKFKFTNYFADSSCNGVPQLVSIDEATGCDNLQNCVEFSVGTAITHNKSECFNDHQTNVNAEFMNRDASYVLMELYNDKICGDLTRALAFNGDGACRALPDVLTNYGSVIASVGADLAVNVQLFADESCNSTSSSDIYIFDLSSDEITQCVPGSTLSGRIPAASGRTDFGQIVPRCP